MSEKLEQIKKLHTEVFVEEYGVTKEQALKLNDFLVHEPSVTDYHFWRGPEKVSVRELIARVEKHSTVQDRRITQLEEGSAKTQMWLVFWMLLSSVAFIYIFVNL